MRDNWNTDELSDQAWAQMREMLDREMPVDGRSRKPAAFWWFWLAAAVLLVGLVAMLWFKPAEIPLFDSNMANDEIGSQGQVADVDKKDQNATVLTPGKQNKTKNQSSKTAVVSGNPQYTDLISAAQSSLGTTPKESRLNAIPGHPKEVNKTSDYALNNPASEGVQDKEEKDRPLNQEEVLTQETFLEAPTTKPEQEIQAHSIAEVDQDVTPNTLEKIYLSMLPEEAIAPLDQEPLPLSRIHKYDPKRPLFVPLELNAGLIAGLESGGITGVMTELRTGLKLGSTGKWSLGSGIGLHLQREPFRIDLKRANNLDQVNVATPDVGNQNGSDPQAQDTSPMSLAQVLESNDVDLQAIYFDVPILLNWQFSRHWSLATGGRLSWLLGSSWESNNTTTNESLGFSGGGTTVALSSSGRQYVIQQSGNNSGPSTLVLNDFFAAATLGISFRPNVNWNIRLQYQHSLSNQLENTTYRKTDRSFWLSAGFQF